jgi:hypothetical protein
MTQDNNWLERFIRTMNDEEKARFLEIMQEFKDIPPNDSLYIVLAATGRLQTWVERLPAILSNFNEELAQWGTNNLEILENLVQHSDQLADTATNTAALTSAVNTLSEILQRSPQLQSEQDKNSEPSSKTSMPFYSNGECTAWKAAQNIEGRVLRVEHILARHLGIRHWTLNTAFMLIGGIITYILVAARYGLPLPQAGL